MSRNERRWCALLVAVYVPATAFIGWGLADLMRGS